jgi:hypothetical protein
VTLDLANLTDVNDLALEARWARHPEVVERLIDRVYRIGLLVCRRYYAGLLENCLDDVLSTVISTVWETVEKWDVDNGDFIGYYYKACLVSLRGLAEAVNEKNRFKHPRPSIIPLSGLARTSDENGEEVEYEPSTEQRPRLVGMTTCAVCDQPPKSDGLTNGLCGRCRMRRKRAAAATGTNGFCEDCLMIYQRLNRRYVCPCCGKDPVVNSTRRDNDR